MNIQIDCENRTCRETITGDDIVYCEKCYDKLVDELAEKDEEIERLKNEKAKLIDEIETMKEK